MATAKLRSDGISKETHGRLMNWGRHYRVDDTLRKLQIKGKSNFVIAPSKSGTVDVQDAELIEFVVSRLSQVSMSARIQAFALKLFYAEKPEDYLATPIDMARDLKNKFPKCGESQRTFERYLRKGRIMVERWTPKLNTLDVSARISIFGEAE